MKKLKAMYSGQILFSSLLFIARGLLRIPFFRYWPKRNDRRVTVEGFGAKMQSKLHLKKTNRKSNPTTIAQFHGKISTADREVSVVVFARGILTKIAAWLENAKKV